MSNLTKWGADNRWQTAVTFLLAEKIRLETYGLRAKIARKAEKRRNIIDSISR